MGSLKQQQCRYWKKSQPIQFYSYRHSIITSYIFTNFVEILMLLGTTSWLTAQVNRAKTLSRPLLNCQLCRKGTSGFGHLSSGIDQQRRARPTFQGSSSTIFGAFFGAGLLRSSSSCLFHAMHPNISYRFPYFNWCRFHSFLLFSSILLLIIIK